MAIIYDPVWGNSFLKCDKCESEFSAKHGAEEWEYCPFCRESAERENRANEDE